MKDYQSELIQLTETLRQEGITDQRVLDAIAQVPRHLFVPEYLRSDAYLDMALPIEHGQTISQPYVVARMTELVTSGREINTVLEIGTGSGYQAAVLAQIAKQVFTIERIESLLKDAIRRFKMCHIDNIHCRYADGNQGWSAHAPYDAIMVTAAAEAPPTALLEQLADGGQMIIPVKAATWAQQLLRITRKGAQYNTEEFDAVMFVPLLPGQQ